MYNCIGSMPHAGEEPGHQVCSLLCKIKRLEAPDLLLISALLLGIIAELGFPLLCWSWL
jgi:hypothetical protein